jgi:uncharacterized damage-inducible protein DinB
MSCYLVLIFVISQQKLTLMKHLLADYARYNLWANERLINIFRTTKDELIEQTISSSFPSVRQTVLHIWDAESIWLERLNDNSPTSFPSTTFTGTNAEAFDGLIGSSTAFLQFVENRPAPFFRERKRIMTLKGGEYHELVTDMIHHCLNHSTFHRGQLVMMCRQLGISHIPATDFIFYKRETKKK